MLSSEVKALLPQTTIIKADEPFEFNQFKVIPIMPHDANEPVGFIFGRIWKEICFTYRYWVCRPKLYRDFKRC